MAQQISWGTTTLILDNEAFRQGFLAARRWYFEDIYGEDGRPPEEPQCAIHLSSEELLRLVVLPDEQGHYHFDEMGEENLPEYLGYHWLPERPAYPTGSARGHNSVDHRVARGIEEAAGRVYP